jgi:hypothetical protein
MSEYKSLVTNPVTGTCEHEANIRFPRKAISRPPDRLLFSEGVEIQ